MTRPTLSVILITKNEAELVARCLESVKWADEIIVLDSGSTDDTVEICRRYTDQVEVTDWPGFGPQKNRALAKARGEWVLSIDADEEVSEDLKNSIITAMTSPSAHHVYEINRFSSYCGRFIRHSGWWPDRVLRLFKNGHGRFSDHRVHERVLVDQQPVGLLDGLLIHHSFRNLEQVLSKVNHYSSENADMLLSQGRRASLGTAIFHGAWTFFRSYILRAGFLDGREGFILAVSNAEGSYYKYLKLMYRNEKEL
jgi:glycosyltransferase involved in cell wall biosynthesis